MIIYKQNAPAALAFLAGALVTAGAAGGAELYALSEWFRPSPSGEIAVPDRHGTEFLKRVQIKTARNGYVSFQLVLKGAGDGARLVIEFNPPSPLGVDVYREWFHGTVPDALIPVSAPIPVPKAAVEAFWVDVWIPSNAEPRIYQGEARLSRGGVVNPIQIELTVLPSEFPERDPVTLDNNSYGTSWLLEQYPKTLASLRTGGGDESELFRLIHEHHRIFYDHRGTFHQLGYGHAGKVGPEFAPVLAGSGRGRHIANWTRFDQHYGPLLDGSAFRQSRRPARPIPFMYLPINPEWPASYLWWGEPGYEAEFVNVVSEMERHFREKGWTHTQLEVFFNHKKRYKGFSWDGDEIRFERDNPNLLEYARMLRKAIPPDSPVPFVMRADVSWTLDRQFALLKGAVKFWVAGEGTYGWFPGDAREVLDRGDRVWTYGGTPSIFQVSTQITLNPLRSWIWGVDGFVRWLTVSPGLDPWVHLDDEGKETLIYPGERFGIPGPLPSIRLKLQRNCLQDLALLERAALTKPRVDLQAEVVRRFNASRLSDWQNSKPALSGPALDWNNADIEEALRPFESRFANLRPDAWRRVREYAQEVDR